MIGACYNYSKTHTFLFRHWKIVQWIENRSVKPLEKSFEKYSRSAFIVPFLKIALTVLSKV